VVSALHTQCSSVVSSCALGTFTKFSWINSIVGTILGFPLILSFTGLRTCMQQASDSIMAVADSSMWWITGFFAFHKSNFRTWTNKRTAANNVLLYTFLLAFVSILCMVAGVSGLAKFYLAPLVVFYLWHSISIKVGRSLQVTFEHDETITKLISSISKQYEHQAISLPNVSRLVAKGNRFLLHQRNHTFISAFESLFGWEQVTPSDIAFQSLQQFKMVDTATLRSQAAKVIESEEVEFVNTPEPVNRSWDTYHFDVSKTLKLLGIHGAGLYGVYLLMTADIHPYTKVFAFIHYFFCGLLPPSSLLFLSFLLRSRHHGRLPPAVGSQDIRGAPVGAGPLCVLWRRHWRGLHPVVVARPSHAPQIQ
jgi:hypothetical protein